MSNREVMLIILVSFVIFSLLYAWFYTWLINFIVPLRDPDDYAEDDTHVIYPAKAEVSSSEVALQPVGTRRFVGKALSVVQRLYRSSAIKTRPFTGEDWSCRDQD